MARGEASRKRACCLGPGAPRYYKAFTSAECGHFFLANRVYDIILVAKYLLLASASGFARMNVNISNMR